MAKTSTFGVMPTLEEFTEAFDAVCPDGAFNIQLSSFDSRALDGFNLGDGDWKCEELYLALLQIVQYWQTSGEPDEGNTDGAIDLVSAVLSVLGFEWV